MALATGQLNRKVAIEKRNPAKDALNIPLPGYVEVMKVWGRFIVQSGYSVVKNAGPDGLTKGVTAYILRIRYRPTGIDEGMRVNYKNEKFFDIVSLRHDIAGKEWTDLILHEGAKDG